MTRQTVKLSALSVAALAAIGFVWFGYRGDNAPTTAQTPTQSTPTPKTNPAPEPIPFDTSQYSITDPASPWVIVNKSNPLSPRDYAPSDLRAPNVALSASASSARMQLRDQAATALEAMFAAATSDGHKLRVDSAYRSYTYQKTVNDRIVAQIGQTAADRESARPGYSEHQTGWAVDVGPKSGGCNLSACFGDLPSGIWVAENAHRYGFIVRYGKTQEAITGYTYEPWHLRYVGVALATEIASRDMITLEAFFDVTGGTTYE